MSSFNPDYSDYSDKFQGWMQTAKLSSLRSLSKVSGVSRRQIEKLRCGESHRLSVQHAIALARALNISLATLLELEDPSSASTTTTQSTLLKAEYQRLQGEMANLRSQLFQSFQAETLHTLEMLLIQWPTASHAAQQNPELPAVRLLPLLHPLEKLLQGWHIEVIGEVGQAMGYSPQWHQWQGPEAPPAPDTPVQVTHVGYRQGDRLLYRAKVKLIDGESEIC